jgi:protein involved in polysaccharide export with SLBB domain
MKRFVTLGLLLSVGLGGASACGGASRSVQSKDLTVGQDDTRLGPGDVFEVRVYEEKELSGKFRVANNGTVDYPFIGRIEVASMEPHQVADVISKKLVEGGYLRAPQVSVFVEQYNSKRITVLGAVAKPGAFPMTSGLTIVQAISFAGGFTSIAAEDDTVITRKVDGKLKRYKVPVREMMEGKVDDFALQSGDSIFVPERVF